MDKEESKTYEISFLTKEEKSREEILGLLKKQGIQISSDGQFTKLKLAYPIKKEQFGYFGYIYFPAKPEDLEAIRGSLKTNPQILRFSIAHVERAREDGPRRSFSRPSRRQARAGEELKVPSLTETSDKSKEPELERRERSGTRRQAQGEFKGELSNEALEKKLEEILS